MERLLNNNRVRTLLRQADDATRLLDRMGDGAETTEIREALSGILRDLGREVHVVWRDMVATSGADPFAAGDDFEFLKRADASEERTAESLEIDPHTDIPEITSDRPADAEDLERWYTDEVEIQRQEPLFNPGELDTSADTDAGGSPPGLVRHADDDVPVVPVDGFEVAPYAADEDWVKALREFVALLGAPPADDSDLTEEASKVQWAASGLDVRWGGFPPAVRTALLGVLASRARVLQEHLEVDIGPRMALDRMRKHRKASDLPSVAGLGAERGPETGSWSEDARWWWRALTAGLDGGPSGG